MSVVPLPAFPALPAAAPRGDAIAAPSAPVLLDALLAAPSLREGAHRLAAALAAALRVERVAIGLYGLDHGSELRLVATSPIGLDALDPAARSALLGAMAEAAEQGIALAFPPTEAGIGPVLVEHAQLHAARGRALASVPLGEQGEPLGVVCVERSTADAPGFDADTLQRLEQALRPITPALRWMRAAEHSALQRLLRRLRERIDAARRPEKRLWRRAAAAALVIVAALAVVPVTSSVSGRARIEGAEQRVLSAPADGFVKVVHARPGDRVHAGDALVDLVDADLRLERERWSQQLVQHENAYAAAMAKSDRVGAATSLARAGEAQAQLALVDEQLLRGQVTAPFDGLVVDGDLSRSIGAPVRQGDPLVTLASSGRHRVIVEVDEVDVARVQAGQAGTLALSALPWDGQALVVERIAPLAKAVDGRNVFEVEARLAAPREDLRAGLLGRASLEADRVPLLWAWTRGLLLRLRVAVWSWLE